MVDFLTRRESLSTIIERIVMEKERQRKERVLSNIITQDENLERKKIEQNQPNVPIKKEDIEETDQPRQPSPSPQREDEEEVEDEDEVDDREDLKYDQERLKAFNMFVRLFVDENLNRVVPISKQPKEKIQAIIDSCARQFPEFVDRARKRLRTYLKSCRRNKRHREHAGLDYGGGADTMTLGSLGAGSGAAMRTCRPIPPHLTSVQAEQILAQACENESQNAKRMRIGLDPIGQPMPVLSHHQPHQNETTSLASVVSGGRLVASVTNTANIQSKSLNTPENSQQQQQLCPAATTSSTTALHTAALSQNGGGLNGVSKSLVRPQLTSSEVTALRQLILGYRESASFLTRSADELETLIRQSGH